MSKEMLYYLPEGLRSYLETMEDGEIGGFLVTLVIMLVVEFVLFAVFMFIAFKVKKKVFIKLEEKRGKNITLQFLETAVDMGLIILIFVFVFGRKNIAGSLLGSTAVVAAVVGFAAQDAIKDIIAGLLISIYKPFDVGSRIEFEDGTAGIVESLNFRHVVLKGQDTTRYIIPNSKANVMKLVNYSFADVPRSIPVEFAIAYDSDVEKAKRVIDEAICNSPLTLNEEHFDPNDPNSRRVYFLKLADSSLIMGATVYYPPNVRTEVIKDDVNSRVFKALGDNGIEIPYGYMNVVMKQ